MASHTADHPSDALPEKKPRKESGDGDKGEVLESGVDMIEEQLLIRNSKEINIYGFTFQLEHKLMCEEPFFSAGFVKWSSQGTHLIAIHNNHIFIWEVGTALEPIMFCRRSQRVCLIDLSPRDDYLVTCCSDATVMLKIFDVQTGKFKKGFKGDKNALEEIEDKFKVSCPLIRWSGGDGGKYFALIQNNMLHIYETQNFDLISSNSPEFANVSNFSWSPTDTVLALFSPASGSGDRNAKVLLIEFNTRKILAEILMAGVQSCKMYWQSAGDYLAVTYDGSEQTDTDPQAGFLLVRMGETTISSELKVLNRFSKSLDFAWEVRGHRFGVIYAIGEKIQTSFFSMRDGRAGIPQTCSHQSTLKDVWANSLNWSPVEGLVVLAGWGNLNFYDGDAKKILASRSATTTSIIQWSPTGRYLATSGFADNKWNVVHIWSSRGELLCKIDTWGEVNQLLWRPKLPSPCFFTQFGVIVDNESSSQKISKLIDKKRSKQ